MLYYLFRSILQGEHYAYENPLFRGGLAALFCFLLIALAGQAGIRQLMRYKLGDRPEFDHDTLNKLMKDKENVPTMGGVMIVGAILAATLLFADFRNFYVLMGMFGLVWLSVLGAVDDWIKLTLAQRGGGRDGLKSHEKLLFQFGLGVLLGYFVYSFGRSNLAVVADSVEPIESFRVLTVPFYKQGLFLTPFLFMAVTVLVTTATSNSVNLTDGMDGLASGCVALTALVFMVLSYVAGDSELAGKLLMPHIPKSGELAVICGAIMGATLGFLWYNCHPAQVFMGDTGSLPLGGLIGYVAIVIRQELMLFIVGGVFVLEALSVIIQVGYFKYSGGKRVFRCAPIHHHFHLAGWTETQTVIRFWLLAALFAGAALATIKLR
ncbi:MAG: phospho-N-acetylmuramoyl-pentapeptide-transferase [Phycisphaerae bacterium]|nr:MAG: phospho-N-acetylmuramoyl-pentapeptide-transferase [Phycisphaerae bacterium]